MKSGMGTMNLFLLAFNSSHNYLHQSLQGNSAHGGHYVTELMDWEDCEERKWWHYDDCLVCPTLNPADHPIIRKKVLKEKSKSKVDVTELKNKRNSKHVSDGSDDEVVDIDDEDYSDDKVKKLKQKTKQKPKNRTKVEIGLKNDEAILVCDERSESMDCDNRNITEVCDLCDDAEGEAERNIEEVLELVEIERGRTPDFVCAVDSSLSNTRSSRRLVNSDNRSSGSSRVTNCKGKGKGSSSSSANNSNSNVDSISTLKRKRTVKKVPNTREIPEPAIITDSKVEEDGSLKVNPEGDIGESDKSPTQTQMKFPVFDRSKDAYILCYVKKKSVDDCLHRLRQLPTSCVQRSVEETSAAFLTEVEKYATKRDLISQEIMERKKIFQEVSQSWLPRRENGQGEGKEELEEVYHLLPTTWLNQWCSGEANRKAVNSLTGTQKKESVDNKDNAVDLTSPPDKTKKEKEKKKMVQKEGIRKNDRVVLLNGSDALQVLHQGNSDRNHIDMTTLADIVHSSPGDHNHRNVVNDSNGDSDGVYPSNIGSNNNQICVDTQTLNSQEVPGGTKKDIMEEIKAEIEIIYEVELPVNKQLERKLFREDSLSVEDDDEVEPDVIEGKIGLTPVECADVGSGSDWEGGGESDSRVFNEAVDDHILPLLCPHYLINGVCSVHPDNISAFKVVSHQAYTAIMATVGAKKKSPSLSIRSDSILITNGNENGSGDSGDSCKDRHNNSSGTDGTDYRNINDNCGRLTPIKPLEEESDKVVCYIQDPHSQHDHAKLTGLDVTSMTFRCEICYAEVLSKRSSLQVRYREMRMIMSNKEIMI